MTKYQLLIVNDRIWNRDLRRIPKNIYLSLKEKILNLVDFPEQGDIKKLSSNFTADYRLRVGRYRILFDVDENSKKILLYRVLHRSCSYRM